MNRAPLQEMPSSADNYSSNNDSTRKPRTRRNIFHDSDDEDDDLAMVAHEEPRARGKKLRRKSTQHARRESINQDDQDDQDDAFEPEAPHPSRRGRRTHHEDAMDEEEEPPARDLEQEALDEAERQADAMLLNTDGLDDQALGTRDTAELMEQMRQRVGGQHYDPDQDVDERRQLRLDYRQRITEVEAMNQHFRNEGTSGSGQVIDRLIETLDQADRMFVQGMFVSNA